MSSVLSAVAGFFRNLRPSVVPIYNERNEFVGYRDASPSPSPQKRQAGKLGLRLEDACIDESEDGDIDVDSQVVISPGRSPLKELAKSPMGNVSFGDTPKGRLQYDSDVLRDDAAFRARLACLSLGVDSPRAAPARSPSPSRDHRTPTHKGVASSPRYSPPGSLASPNRSYPTPSRNTSHVPRATHPSTTPRRATAARASPAHASPERDSPVRAMLLSPTRVHELADEWTVASASDFGYASDSDRDESRGLQALTVANVTCVSRLEIPDLYVDTDSDNSDAYSGRDQTFVHNPHAGRSDFSGYLPDVPKMAYMATDDIDSPLRKWEQERKDVIRELREEDSFKLELHTRDAGASTRKTLLDAEIRAAEWSRQVAGKLAKEQAARDKAVSDDLAKVQEEHKRQELAGMKRMRDFFERRKAEEQARLKAHQDALEAYLAEDIWERVKEQFISAAMLDIVEEVLKAAAPPAPSPAAPPSAPKGPVTKGEHPPPKTSASSDFVSPAGLAEYQRRRTAQEKLNANLALFEQNAQMEPIRKLVERSVKLAVQQISATMEQVRAKAVQLTDLVKNAQSTGDPTAYFFTLKKIAARMVAQGEHQQDNLNITFAYAHVLVHLCQQFPELTDIFVGYLNSTCTYSIPFYRRRKKDQSPEEFNKVIGFADQSIEKYVQRMKGYVRLYVAFMVVEPQQRGSPHPHGIDQCWTFLSRLLNMPPFTIPVSGEMVMAVLETGGHRLLQSYGSQFQKVLNLVRVDWAPRLTDHEVAVRTNILTYVEKFNQGRKIDPPDGWVIPEQ